MPTYDYVCESCGHTFEERQGMNEPVLTTCPKCQQPTLRRKIGKGSPPVFHGSGFYATDYGKGKSVLED
ncbi:MAG: zinc ribbon domain-containing protein [Patescibacteria group bacterium]